MLRVLFYLCCILMGSFSWAQTESSVSLLDNRFRVDPTIKQISFVIYRENPSSSVILVRPDGTKYYAWDHPESVSWYEESSMDIVSIDNPMPGPWQAIGKVTPRNNIKLLSDLILKVDTFPSRLYHNESLKFTARLEQDGTPLVLKDFLDRVELSVDFIQYVEDEENPELTEEPKVTKLGKFLDDGKDFDEVAGDGVFTVELPITVEPGKYKVRITSGNGVFLRAKEQTVLVYPSPIAADFTQSREENLDHTIAITGEQGMILPGTLAAHIVQTFPDGHTVITQHSAAPNALAMVFSLPNEPQLGRHTWGGTVYATEGAAERELILQLEEYAYSVMAKADIEKSTAEFQRIQEENRKKRELEKMKKDREEARMSGMLTILVGNLIVIVLGLAIWFLIKMLRARKAAEPAMQLDMPPKK